MTNSLKEAEQSYLSLKASFGNSCSTKLSDAKRFVEQTLAQLSGEGGIRTLDTLFRVYSLSRGALSTAQPPLQGKSQI